MNKPVALALIFISLTASCTIAANPVRAAAEDSWISKAPSPTASTQQPTSSLNPQQTPFQAELVYAAAAAAAAIGIVAALAVLAKRKRH